MISPQTLHEWRMWYQRQSFINLQCVKCFRVQAKWEQFFVFIFSLVIVITINFNQLQHPFPFLHRWFPLTTIHNLCWNNIEKIKLLAKIHKARNTIPSAERWTNFTLPYYLLATTSNSDVYWQQNKVVELSQQLRNKFEEFYTENRMNANVIITTASCSCQHLLSIDLKFLHL